MIASEAVSMKRIVRTLADIPCLALLVLRVIGQSTAPPLGPTFTVADVHPSPSRLHPGIDGRFTPDRVVLRDATVDDLISIAYHVDPSDILGGPAWLAFDRFDINAKPPAGTKMANEGDDPAAAAMLRALLIDRFALVARVDQRPLPAFVLSVGKGNLMKPAADTTSGGCQYQQQAATSAGSVSQLIHFSCRNTTMSNFAEFLHDVGSPYFNRPVVDQTGLKGGWDFDLQWSYNKLTGGNGISLPDALSKQLGLKVESKPAPTPVVVIQSVSEKPTPNVPDMATLLPPPPPKQFDVAVIREANPGEKNFNINISGRRVAVQFATLQTLIYKSFDTPPNNIQNKPKWLDDVHYDIVGTVASSSAVAPIPGHEADIDYEDVKEMLRSLLADRFKLTTHMGTVPATVFALTADSPKMKLSPDSEHPVCAEGPGPDGKDLRVDNPLRNRLISCQHMTMAQFAVELHNLASGFVPAPVVNSTGLTGAYDFSVSFSRANLLRAPASAPSTGAPSASSDSEASDPGIGGLPPVSLFDALQKQLGLKLVKKDSVPQPVLVIDHVEEKPTEN
jgi:uncharacterized protein (TIGR03435 family)